MPKNSLTISEKIAGGIVGLLVGDALGVPYEFHPPRQIPEFDQIEFKPPSGFIRAHRGVPPGTWSDDGAQALCLLESLLDCGELDLGDFGARMVAWCDDGHLAVGGKVFDIGVTTSRAIDAIRSGKTSEHAGPSGERDNGNGSLMRSLPLALWHRGSNEELARDAMWQSKVTHGHPRSAVCCALYCLWARGELNELDNSWGWAVSELYDVLEPKSREIEELEFSIRPNVPSEARGSGYVVDCLRSAVSVCGYDNYETVVREAIRLGNDTDTTACVAGGIAGIRAGERGIPDRWRLNLRGRELYEPLLTRLVARHQDTIG